MSWDAYWLFLDAFRTREDAGKDKLALEQDAARVYFSGPHMADNSNGTYPQWHVESTMSRVQKKQAGA